MDWFPVTDPLLDAPDGSVLTDGAGVTWKRCRMEWIRVAPLDAEEHWYAMNDGWVD